MLRAVFFQPAGPHPAAHAARLHLRQPRPHAERAGHPLPGAGVPHLTIRKFEMANTHSVYYILYIMYITLHPVLLSAPPPVPHPTSSTPPATPPHNPTLFPIAVACKLRPKRSRDCLKSLTRVSCASRVPPAPSPHSHPHKARRGHLFVHLLCTLPVIFITPNYGICFCNPYSPARPSTPRWWSRSPAWRWTTR